MEEWWLEVVLKSARSRLAVAEVVELRLGTCRQLVVRLCTLA
jgi:hypothetical protein